MRTIVLLALLGGAFAKQNPVCLLPKDDGPCRAYVPRYYYNITTKKCEPFIYGGCQGNANNFALLLQCQYTCEVPVNSDLQKGEVVPDLEEGLDPVCLLKPDSGPCFANMGRYYYNYTLNTCPILSYGGCKGNPNNFLTRGECEQRCKRKVEVSATADPVQDTSDAVVHNFACLLQPDPGTCNAYIPRYNFDNVTGTCKEFVYGGCGGNWNNYETLQQCMASCSPTTDYERKCLARAEIGPCRAGIPMWAYYPTEGQCKQFLYGGCDGNDNKYRTREECESTCLRTEDSTLAKNLGEVEAITHPFFQMTSSPVCTLEKDVGPCKGYFPRHYFNTTTRTCEVFVYGGCRGNGNNFMSRTECLTTCQLEYAVLPRA